MCTTVSMVDDEIYNTLVGARNKIVHDFDETLKNASAVPIIFGQEAYDELVRRAIEERDNIVAELDERIHRRICQLAIEQLSQ